MNLKNYCKSVDPISPPALALIFLGLVSLCFVTYYNSFLNGFVWDDLFIVVNDYNKNIANVLSSFFSADTVFKDDVNAYYRPLNRITYLLEYFFYGFNPKGYHLVNVFIHLINSFLIYLLARLLFNNKFLPLFASMLFLVHPINAEAVNFISARNTLLSTLFSLLACICYIDGINRGNTTKYIWSALCVFLGLLCKETALMAVPLLFLYKNTSYPDLMANLKSRIKPFSFFCIAISAYLCLRFYVLSGLILDSSGGKGLFERVFDNIYILPKYLYLIAFPFEMQNRHQLPQSYADHFLLIIFFWLLIFVAIYSIVKYGNSSHLFCLFWFFINYIPICGLVPIPSATISERFMYLPAIGLWLLLASLLQSGFESGFFKKSAICISVLVLITLAVTTSQRNLDWRDNLSLFSSLVAVTPSSVDGHYNLGQAYMDQGDQSKAEEHWSQTVKLDPMHSKAWNHLGNLALLKNNLNDAERKYNKSLSINEQNSEAHYNMALIMEQTGRIRQALYHYQSFLQNVPPEHEYLVDETNARVNFLKNRIKL